MASQFSTFISGDEINHLEGMELLKTLEVVGHQDFGFFRGTSSQWEAAISFLTTTKKKYLRPCLSLRWQNQK